MTTPSANDSPGPGGRQHRVGVTRREAMQIGYSGLLGVGLTSALPARATAQAPPLKGSVKPEADRLTRTPRRVAEQLAAIYGNRFEQVAYIPALPLVAKLRLSELSGDMKYAERVNILVAPFLRGEKSPVPKSGSEQAGHLLFAELAPRALGKNRERWIRLGRAAADQIFGEDGNPLPVMRFHNEMSDAVFMAGPILAATGKLTGERKYFDAAVTHLASMRTFCLRTDGLYRHSPLCEAAWGRGNGFPALGLAFALSDWPDDHPVREDLLAAFRKHMAALKPHQDAGTGCWHQVIDHPESDDEYSCTCMIGCAMQRGIRRGWLAEEYRPCVDRAWRAILERTDPDGRLVNVCASTGKQKTLQDYFNRPAINGRDDRGGAMGLIFSVELLAANDLHGVCIAPVGSIDIGDSDNHPVRRVRR
jgi:rhamnogalacturonyl hydrolase YesR